MELQINVADDLNNWSDSVGGSRQTHWQDSFLGNRGSHWQDELSTNVGLGAGALSENLSDTFTLSDGTYALQYDYDLEVNEDLNLWADAQSNSGAASGTLTIDVNDSLNNWLDTFAGDRKTRWSDSQANQRNDIAGSLAEVLTDSFTLTDGSESLTLDYEIDANDDCNNWLDEASALALTAGELILIVAEDANNLSDAVSTFEANTLINQSVADDLNVWNDSQSLGYGLQPSDDANNFSDAVTTTRGIPNLTIALSDDLNNWQEKLVKTGDDALAVRKNIESSIIVSANVDTATLAINDTAVIIIKTRDPDA